MPTSHIFMNYFWPVCTFNILSVIISLLLLIHFISLTLADRKRCHCIGADWAVIVPGCSAWAGTSTTDGVGPTTTWSVDVRETARTEHSRSAECGGWTTTTGTRRLGQLCCLPLSHDSFVLFVLMYSFLDHILFHKNYWKRFQIWQFYAFSLQIWS